ncbi:MAG: PAS domain-containing protein, partial [Burkholderiaceae bacterium]
MAVPEPRLPEASFALPAPLAEREALPQVLDASDSAIIVTNEHRCITYVNGGFERMFGYRLAHILGRPPSELLIGPHTDSALLQTIRDSLRLQGRYAGEALVYDQAQ